MALAAVAVYLGFVGFARFWREGEVGGRAAVMGSLLGLLVLAPFALGAGAMALHPQLHDISTDLDDPPSLEAIAALRNGAMNRIRAISPRAAALQRDAYPDLLPRVYDLPAPLVFEAALAAAEAQGWRVVRSAPPRAGAAGLIEAEAMSDLLGFRADVAVRVVGGPERARVDVRSASRYLRHDLGGNARRVRRYLEALDAQAADLEIIPAE
jgi:uncharacterized protein (DUF1499 family)